MTVKPRFLNQKSIEDRPTIVRRSLISDCGLDRIIGKGHSGMLVSVV